MLYGLIQAAPVWDDLKYHFGSSEDNKGCKTIPLPSLRRYNTSHAFVFGQKLEVNHR